MEKFGTAIINHWEECNSKLQSRTMSSYYRGWGVYKQAVALANEVNEQLKFIKKLKSMSDTAWECVASLIDDCSGNQSPEGGRGGGGASAGAAKDSWKKYRFGTVGALLDSEFLRRSMDGVLDDVQQSIEYWLELD